MATYATTPALTLRQLRAKIVLKDTNLRHVAALAKVPYQTASGILRGRLVNPRYLTRLSAAVDSIPTPA